MTSSTDQARLDDGTVPRADRVARLTAQWQRELSGLGGSNALLWFRDLPDTTLDLTGAHPSGLAKLLSKGTATLPELVRRPEALADALRRARQIGHTADRLYAQRGVAGAHLAIGVARWTITGSARVPASPVLLRGVRIVIGHRGAQDVALHLTGDLRVNDALITYLRSEQGLHIDAARVRALAGDRAGSDPSAAYRELERLCADVPDFRIEPRLIVGLFATVKLPLLRDLGEDPQTRAHHPVIAALAGDDDAVEQLAAVPPPTGTIAAEDERLACDADHEQQDVVEGVRAGAHMVVVGAPGTGKTQTAANLIAALAADGRRTLFVSHQRVAIDAVRARLDEAGLGDLLLDMHGENARAGRVAAYLTEVLDRRLDAEMRAMPAPAGLEEARGRLQAHVETMHLVRDPWGVTVDEAQSRITALEERKPAPRSRVRLGHGDLAGISAARRDELRESVRQLAQMDAWTSLGDPDPWFGARIVGDHQLQRTRELVERLGEGGLADHRGMLARLCEQVGLPQPRTLREAQQQLDLMGRVHTTLETFRPEIFSAPLGDMVAATASRDYRRERGVKLGSMERRRLRREAESLLRPGPAPRALNAVLERAASQRAEWREAAGPGALPSSPVSVPDLTEAHERLRGELEWLGERLSGTREGGELFDAELEGLERRLRHLAKTPDRLAMVPKVIGALDMLRANGLEAFIDDMAARQLAPDQVVHEFDFVWWASLLEEVDATDEAYHGHDGAALREVCAAHLHDDARQVRRAADAVHDDVVRHTRSADRDLPEQVESLRRAAQDERPWSTRELLEAVPELVGTLTPCWAMGPLEVPMHVPAGMWFDVVVCDEGSQIAPSEAAAAISRASQVVVLGDPHQLPPAPLQMTVPDDDAPLPRTEPTSLLDLLAPLVPVRTLHTHYRSSDERLIAFSGLQLYAGGLRSFPSPQQGGALRLDVVSGGEGQGTAPETDRVVQLVLDHLRKDPSESLGVVTLTHRHAERIDDALRAALAGRPEAVRALRTDRSEPFFVRSVDDVQGDVRDVVIFSVGYGRGPAGEVQHTFGALSGAGGERRLGVAISRARRRMVVVSSFSGGELDPSRLRSRGATMLRDYLLYAASGGAGRRVAGDSKPEPRGVSSSAVRVGPDGRRRRMASTGSVRDRPVLRNLPTVSVSPLVADLARRMRAEGLVVHTAYGIGPHRLDLVVEDPRRPGEALMAIETDGAAYGAVGSARDRDRLWVEQLLRRGWRHERVWTRDLFREPAQEVSRLVTAVHAASNERRAADG